MLKYKLNVAGFQFQFRVHHLGGLLKCIIISQQPSTKHSKSCSKYGREMQPFMLDLAFELGHSVCVCECMFESE